MWSKTWPSQSRQLRSDLLSHLNLIRHSFVMCPPGHPIILLSSWPIRKLISRLCPLSESVFRLYSSFPRDVVWAEPVQDAEDLSHRDPAQHNPVLPEAVSQVGDRYLQPSSYFILFSVSEASADSPPTWSSSSPRPEGSTTTSRWSLTPSSSFLTFTILALTIDPPFELSAVLFASSNVAGPGAF